MYSVGSYRAFRYRDVFISIEGWKVVICNVNWYSQHSYDLSSLKENES